MEKPARHLKVNIEIIFFVDIDVYVYLILILILGVFVAQQKMQEQTDTSTDSCALITIMNADGIYLATYAALLLNLKLIQINYYHEEGRQVPISEVCLIANILILFEFVIFIFLNFIF